MKKYVAEAIGTFVLTFLGCGAAVSLGCAESNTAAVVGTAIAFGLAVVAMAYTIGGISGCHIPPSRWAASSISACQQKTLAATGADNSSAASLQVLCWLPSTAASQDWALTALQA